MEIFFGFFFGRLFGFCGNLEVDVFFGGGFWEVVWFLGFVV